MDDLAYGRNVEGPIVIVITKFLFYLTLYLIQTAMGPTPTVYEYKLKGT